jgi:molybdopterin-binding protein
MFSGAICDLQVSGLMSRVKVSVGPTMFSAVILETPETAPYLKIGEPVMVLFKETEVIVAKGVTGAISIRNRGTAKVVSLERSAITTKIVMTHPAGRMVSVISSEGADEIGIAPGDELEWFVKMNEVSIAH